MLWCRLFINNHESAMADKYRLYGVRKKMLAYIIVNETFPGDTLNNRKGASRDLINMKELFNLLNFDVLTFQDKSAFEIHDIFKRAMTRPDLADVSCFVCVISTHGELCKSKTVHSHQTTEKHFLFGVDGRHISTQSIVNTIGKCPLLDGKPKLFFVQACRSNMDENAFDDGVEINLYNQCDVEKELNITEAGEHEKTTEARSDERWVNCEEQNERFDEQPLFENKPFQISSHHENNDLNSLTGTRAPQDSTECWKYRYNIDHHFTDTSQQSPTDTSLNADTILSTKTRRQDYQSHPTLLADDMLTMFASPPGKFAWRNAVSGGWLLSQLYSVVKNHIRYNTLYDTDFLSVLTEVTCSVAAEMQSHTLETETDAKKMCPVIEHTLTKDLIF